MVKHRINLVRALEGVAIQSTERVNTRVCKMAKKYCNGMGRMERWERKHELGNDRTTEAMLDHLNSLEMDTVHETTYKQH